MVGDKQCILIVEDSRTYAELLHRQIDRQLDFEVLRAADLATARQLIETHKDRIFLAILDLNLPDAPDGEVVDMVLENGISAIVLTATFDNAVREKVVSKSIIDYVVKENVHDLEYVVKLIRRAVRNQQTKILIVDDSGTYRYVLKSQLLPYKFQILEAENGRAALEILKQNEDIQLVITDNQMPVMDGFELITEIRKSHPREQLSVIGLSASSGGALTAGFLKRGANDFLSKPYSKEELYCRVSQNVEITDLIREIKETSNRDYLTGLFNRRYFYDIGDRYFASARRNHLQLVVAMIDIDFFKSVNDSFGHEAGDLVISAIARTIKDDLRQTDVVARMGGEEFCVLAVNAGPSYEKVFERIRAKVQEVLIPYENKEISVTVSCGVTGQLAETLSDTVRKADELLYMAKQQGRNRILTDFESAESEGEPAAS